MFFPWGVHREAGREKWELKVWGRKKEKNIFSLGIRYKIIQNTNTTQW